MLKIDPAAGEPRRLVGLEARIADPAAYYATPDDAVADPDLDRDQKLRLLAGWAQAVFDTQVAGGADAAEDALGETMLLRQLHAAFEAVEASPVDPMGLGRIWRLLRIG